MRTVDERAADRGPKITRKLLLFSRIIKKFVELCSRLISTRFCFLRFDGRSTYVSLDSLLSRDRLQFNFKELGTELSSNFR